MQLAAVTEKVIRGRCRKLQEQALYLDAVYNRSTCVRDKERVFHQECVVF